MKPLVDDSAPASTKRSARATLYTCLDLGLRLLHPFMPFITEELWQRLPRRPDDPTETIVLAAFPLPEAGRRDADARRDFDRVFASVRALRSLAASVKLTHDWKGAWRARRVARGLRLTVPLAHSLPAGRRRARAAALGERGDDDAGAPQAKGRDDDRGPRRGATGIRRLLVRDDW